MTAETAIDYQLEGLDVSIGTPKVVTEGVGHRWFPRIARFPQGQLLLSHSIVPDKVDLLVGGTAYYLSDTNGDTWPMQFDLSEGPSIKIPLAGNRLGGPAFVPYLMTNDSLRGFECHYTTISGSGDKVVVEPWASSLTGLPRDMDTMDVTNQHGRSKRAHFALHGEAIPVDGGVITNIYGVFAGDQQYSNLAVFSADEGRTWEYRATIAGPGDLPAFREGPCEGSLLRLQSGPILSAMRVGSGRDMKLWRSWSHDDGMTWSPVDSFDGYGVDPTLCQTENGSILLAYGRPGIDVGFSIDDEGRNFQAIDLIDHHNAALTDPRHRIVPATSPDRSERHNHDQTTAYTAMVEISPNTVMLVYDRIPFGWNSVPLDSDERSRVYSVLITVNRR